MARVSETNRYVSALFSVRKWRGIALKYEKF
jgi:hypothetical protein